MSQTAVVVMGMHRSGTSAMTRVLNLLGLELNKGVMPPAEDNVAGFWEANPIVAINDDPHAPIFEIATYGIVGDLFQVVPMLTEKLRS